MEQVEQPAPKRDHADLTVAVIHFETPDLLERCLSAIEGAAPEARVIVVDTGERAPLPADWPASHPGIELLRHENHSYSAAVNAALRRCTTTRFAQMNADAFVTNETFDVLAEVVETSGCAIAGPLVRDGRGRIQAHGILYRRHQQRVIRSGRWTYVPWLSGCLQYLRYDAVQRVGGMDASLRFYNEDMEWCMRLTSVGAKCALAPTQITHLGGSSLRVLERRGATRTPRVPGSSRPAGRATTAPLPAPAPGSAALGTTSGGPAVVANKGAAPLIEGLRGGYVLSRRYRGPLARSLHRGVVLAGTLVLSLIAREPDKRLAYRQVAAMLWHDQVEESPFGESLTTENPLFARPVDNGIGAWR